mgnify:CR=1 FL=1
MGNCVFCGESAWNSPIMEPIYEDLPLEEAVTIYQKIDGSVLNAGKGIGFTYMNQSLSFTKGYGTLCNCDNISFECLEREPFKSREPLVLELVKRICKLMPEIQFGEESKYQKADFVQVFLPAKEVAKRIDQLQQTVDAQMYLSQIGEVLDNREKIQRELLTEGKEPYMEWLDPFYKAVWEKAFVDAIPISGTFELTPRCNFRCRMCYVHLEPSEIPKYGKELTAREWIRIAKGAKEAGTTWLCITGGEPLMHPEFRTIWRELSQMGFFITLQTNASMIDGKFEKLLEAFPPRQVKITLYGTNNDVYEQVCRIPGGFTKVDRGIQRLKEMRIPIQLVSTIIRQNEEDVKRMAFYAYCNQLPWTMTAGSNPQFEVLTMKQGMSVFKKGWTNKKRKRFNIC